MTPWSVAHWAPLSMEFCRQEYYSGLPFPSPEDLPKPGIKPRSPALQVDSLLTEILGKPKSHFKKEKMRLKHKKKCHEKEGEILVILS